jgi:hypothetical protein
MMLHVDRPCRVCFVGGRWQWRCMCPPRAWSHTGSASTWVLAYGAADRHVRAEHPLPVKTPTAGPIAVSTGGQGSRVVRAFPDVDQSDARSSYGSARAA